MSKEIDDLRKRIESNKEDNSLDLGLFGLDINRIKQIDQQAKLFDKTKPVTNRDKGFSDTFNKDGSLNEDYKNSQLTTKEVDDIHREAIAKQKYEKSIAFKEIYETKKQTIIQNMNNILNELDSIDNLLKNL